MGQPLRVNHHTTATLKSRGAVCALLLCAILLAAVGAQQPSSAAVALVGANIIPMNRQQVLENQTLVVQGDRITMFGTAAEVKIPEGATRVDATGKYLIPALGEMHAHVPGGDATDAAIQRVLTLYAANGIGTIRGMLGDPRHLPLRDRIAKGEVFGPALFTSGPSFNGNSVPDAAKAVAMVTEQKQAGYDFLKIHPGVKRDVFDALARTADKLGIRFAGHVPADVGLARALDARYASIDHLDGYMEAMVKDGSPPTPSQWFGLNLVGQVDEAKIPQLVAHTRSAGVSVVPTQTLLENTTDEEAPESKAKWPEMQYADAAQVQQWVQAATKIRSGADAASRARFIALRRRLIKELHTGGVKVLLGSDAPQIFNVPGFSIHRELKLLVASGLTPYQALQSGTILVAGFLNTNGGVIAIGRRADLLLIDGNPLTDISNTSKVVGVVLGGRWKTQQELLKSVN